MKEFIPRSNKGQGKKGECADFIAQMFAFTFGAHFTANRVKLEISHVNVNDYPIPD